MPLNPLIPLQAVTPADLMNQYQTTQANQNKLNMATLEQQAKQQDVDAGAAKAKYDQVANQYKQADMIHNILSNTKDETSWQQGLQQAQSMGLDTSQEPPHFDPNYVRQAMMSTISAKDKLQLEMNSLKNTADVALQNARIGTEHSQSKAYDALAGQRESNPGGASSPFGNGLTGKAYNILLNGDVNSPEYALAYQAATTPRYQQVTNPDGTTQLVAVTPQLPSAIRPPVSGSGVTAPPMPGTQDTTPSTPQSQLLAPPPGASPRSFSATPVEGTQSPPKLTDEQSKAKGFVERMNDASGVLDNLSQGGYSPALGTDTIANAPGGNFALSENGQKFVQAKRNFVNAILRRESGAAISESEFDNANKQYFPQPGDKPGVLAQKAKNREDAINAMKASAGPSMSNARTPTQTVDALPAGAQQIGTSGGKPVYQTPDGKHFMAQ